MKKIFTQFKSLLLLTAAVFSFSAAWAETGTEKETDTSIGGKDTKIEGRSYTIAGTYNAGAGTQYGDMTSKGFKMRTGSDGSRCVFTVNAGYTITSLVGIGISNYNHAEGVDASAWDVKVIKVEVDGEEFTGFTGGEFMEKNSGQTATLSITGIAATTSIAIYFDNSNSGGKQVNFCYEIAWERPDASQPTITVSPATLNLIPGATYQLSSKVDPPSFTTVWGSSDAGVASVDEEGKVTAVAPGTANVSLAWDSNAEVCGTSVITVADFDPSATTKVASYDFTTMGNVTLTIGEEALGKIWNQANTKANDVFRCTNVGLEGLAFQAVCATANDKGWLILDDEAGQGLMLAKGAGRCAAVCDLTAGQIVEVNYTGEGFYTGDKESDTRRDDGATKNPLNEGVGRAIYQMKEDGLFGFEIIKNNFVTSIIVYDGGGVADGIQTVKAQAIDETVYNLAGQKVKNAQKGIFIQNGKKVIK